MKGKSISYTGSGSKVARVSVFCYTGKEISTALEEAGLEEYASTWLSGCDAAADSSEVFCIVALRTGTR